MEELFLSLVLFMAILVIGFVCASFGKQKFSANIFLAVISIGIALMVWLPIIPSWFILISIGCCAMILFGRGGDEI